MHKLQMAPPQELKVCWVDTAAECEGMAAKMVHLCILLAFVPSRDAGRALSIAPHCAHSVRSFYRARYTISDMGYLSCFAGSACTSFIFFEKGIMKSLPRFWTPPSSVIRRHAPSPFATKELRAHVDAGVTTCYTKTYSNIRCPTEK